MVCFLSELLSCKLYFLILFLTLSVACDSEADEMAARLEEKLLECESYDFTSDTLFITAASVESPSINEFYGFETNFPNLRGRLAFREDSLDFFLRLDSLPIEGVADQVFYRDYNFTSKYDIISDSVSVFQLSVNTTIFKQLNTLRLEDTDSVDIKENQFFQELNCTANYNQDLTFTIDTIEYILFFRLAE